MGLSAEALSGIVQAEPDCLLVAGYSAVRIRPQDLETVVLAPTA